MKLAYLSGALRVSTRATATTLGPRTHIRGLISAFKARGDSVDEFIVGDLVQGRTGTDVTEEQISGRLVKRLMADGTRLAAAAIGSRVATARVGTDVDLVYERHALFHQMGRRLQVKGVPWVLESNGIFFEEAQRDRNSSALTGIGRRLERQAYTRADVLVPVTQALADLIFEHELRDRRAPTLVLPNGVDTDLFAPTEGPDGHNGSYVIGFSGTVVKWQNLDLLLSAVRRLREVGTDLRVSIVGDGPHLNSLKKHAREIGLAGAVDFHGRVPLDEVPAYLSRADIGYAGHMTTSSSQMYHSPLKLYEYLALGLPAVASDHPEARALSAQVSGLHLFPTQDIEGLCAAILQAVTSSRDGLGATRREVIVSSHSWHARVAILIEYLLDRGLLHPHTVTT